MGKIFVDPSDVKDFTIEIRDSGDIHHLVKVLRSRVGDRLEISDGVKWEYETVIESMEKDVVICRIEDKQAHSREPKTRVTLYQGFPKATKMDAIIQKCTELGIDAIVPVYMDRSVVTDSGKGEKKLERWQKIADEASTQCRRGKRPVICVPGKFDKLFNTIVNHELIILPYENEDGRTIRDALTEYAKKHPEKLGGYREAAEGKSSAGADIAVIIGPEGGFSEREVKMLKEASADCVSLGRTILRTETAGMAALAMIMYELEL